MQRSVQITFALFFGILTLIATVAVASSAGDGHVPATDLSVIDLHLGIQFFDPGLEERTPRDLEEDGIFPVVRESESRYFPVRLKEALEAQQRWRGVRLVPEGAVVDLAVHGRILTSDGTRLVLRIRAVDAAGEVWLDKKYRARADVDVYAVGPVDGEWPKPFQAVYERIAADLTDRALRRSTDDRERLRWITRLQTAEDLAPAAFAGFLEQDAKGRPTLARLPAEGDPMLARIDRIAEAQRHFFDAWTDHQIDFFSRIREPYGFWLLLSHHNQLALRGRLEQGKRWLEHTEHKDLIERSLDDGVDPPSTRDVSRGVLVKTGVAEAYDKRNEVLKDLGEELSADIEPMWVEVAGRTLRLEGTLETRYQSWRKLLCELFVEETGLAC